MPESTGSVEQRRNCLLKRVSGIIDDIAESRDHEECDASDERLIVRPKTLDSMEIVVMMRIDHKVDEGVLHQQPHHGWADHPCQWHSQFIGRKKWILTCEKGACDSLHFCLTTTVYAICKCGNSSTLITQHHTECQYHVHCDPADVNAILDHSRSSCRLLESRSTTAASHASHTTALRSSLPQRLPFTDK